jgi:hypothetical protein
MVSIVLMIEFLLKTTKTKPEPYNAGIRFNYDPLHYIISVK